MTYLFFQVNFALKVFFHLNWIMFEIRAHPSLRREAFDEYNHENIIFTNSNHNHLSTNIPAIRTAKRCNKQNFTGPISSTTSSPNLETEPGYESFTPVYESTVFPFTTEDTDEYDQSSTADPTDEYDPVSETPNATEDSTNDYEESEAPNTTEDSTDEYDPSGTTDTTEDSIDETHEYSEIPNSVETPTEEVLTTVPTFTEEENESNSNNLISSTMISSGGDNSEGAETSGENENISSPDYSEEISTESEEFVESTSEMSVTDEMEYSYESTEPEFIEESVTEYYDELSSKQPVVGNISTTRKPTNTNTTKTTQSNIPATVPVIGGGMPVG